MMRVLGYFNAAVAVFVCGAGIALLFSGDVTWATVDFLLAAVNFWFAKRNLCA